LYFCLGAKLASFATPAEAPTMASFRTYAGVDLAAGNWGIFSPGSPPSPHTVQERPLCSSTYHPNSPATLESKGRAADWAGFIPGAAPMNWLRSALPATDPIGFVLQLQPVLRWQRRRRLAVLDAETPPHRSDRDGREVFGAVRSGGRKWVPHFA